MQRDDEETRGFDRLRFYGFNDLEIQQFRYQFHMHRLSQQQSPNRNAKKDQDFFYFFAKVIILFIFFLANRRSEITPRIGRRMDQ